MAVTRLDGKIRAVGKDKIPNVSVHAARLLRARELEIEVKDRTDLKPDLRAVSVIVARSRLEHLTISMKMSSLELIELGKAIEQCRTLRSVDLRGSTGYCQRALRFFLASVLRSAVDHMYLCDPVDGMLLGLEDAFERYQLYSIPS